MNLPHVLLPRPHTASRCRMNLPHVLLPRFSLGGASLVSSAKQKTVYIKTRGGALLDAGSGEPVSGPPPDDIDTVKIDNRVRRLIYKALGALR